MSSSHPRCRLASFALVATAFSSFSGCHEALGDPCHDGDTCEQGLECRDGRCQPFQPLPPLADIEIGEEVFLEEFDGAVDLLLDQWGTPHIYAASAADAWMALGYLMARDRGPQLELRRRRARGTLAELTSVEITHAASLDLAARLLAIADDADSAWEAASLESPASVALVAFATGVTAFFERAREGREEVPEGAEELFEGARPWTPADSLAVARLDVLGRAWSGRRELDLHLLVERSLRDFSISASDADSVRRAGFAEDVVRLDPVTPIRAVHAENWPDSALEPVALSPMPLIDSPLFVGGWRRAMVLIEELVGGQPESSAAWVASGRRSASGGGLMSAALSQPLELPSRYYAAHLEWTESSDRRRVAGLCVAGVPAFVAGFNGHLAWVDTPSRADVVDFYMERVEVREGRRTVRFDDELIEIADVELRVSTPEGDLSLQTGFVPHHGPFVPSFDDDTLSRGWNDVAGLTMRISASQAVQGLLLAQEIALSHTVRDAARLAVPQADPTSRWLFADRSGDTGSTLSTLLPRRDSRSLSATPTRTGSSAPLFVMPGDGSAEWSLSDGSIDPEGASSWIIDPVDEVLLAAGADPIGATLDNDPFHDEHLYLGWSFEPGLRTTRLEQLFELSSRRRLDAEAAAEVLLDSSSLAFELLIPALEIALERALHERDETSSEPDLMRLVNELGHRLEMLAEAVAILRSWDRAFSAEEDVTGDNTAAAAVAGVWLLRLFEHVLGDELETLDVTLDNGMALRALTRLFDDEVVLRTFVSGTRESSLFDDLRTGSRFESRDERLLRALDSAMAFLEGEFGDDRSDWSWAALHQVRFRPPPWRSDMNDATVSIAGGTASPWGCMPGLVSGSLGCTRGAPMARITVEMRPWGPNGVISIAGPQSLTGDTSTGNDELEAWARGDHHELPFAIDDVVATSVSRIRFAPPEGGY